MRPQAVINVISKQWQLLEVQYYSRGNYLFHLQTDKIHILRIFCGMEVDDVTRGDKMTRGRDDRVQND
jgi:hypothetical protein